jgi:hypothetical protein
MSECLPAYTGHPSERGQTRDHSSRKSFKPDDDKRLTKLMDREHRLIMTVIRFAVQTPEDLGAKLTLLHAELQRDGRDGEVKRPGLWKALRRDIEAVLLPKQLRKVA